MTAPSPPLMSHYHVGILSLQPRGKATMLGVSTIELSSRRIYMKIEVTSQRREMLLFLTTKMAAVTSPANQARVPRKPNSANRGLNLANRGIQFVPRLDPVPESMTNLNLGIN